MFSAHDHRIYYATAHDADVLRCLAERGACQPLADRVLVGSIAEAAPLPRRVEHLAYPGLDWRAA
jgi:hypothetical protein